MTEEEKNFAIKINLDKAKKKTVIPIVLIIISLLTYIMPLLLGEFDFGIFFEIISLVFLIISRTYMSKYDVDKSKRYIICSMLSIGWILIYDIMYFIFSIQSSIDFIFMGYEFFWTEMLSILYLFFLFVIERDIAKADNPVKYKESTDWFYEKYDENEK